MVARGGPSRPAMTPRECAFCGAEGHPHRLAEWTYALLRMNDGTDTEGWLCPSCNPEGDPDAAEAVATDDADADADGEAEDGER